MFLFFFFKKKCNSIKIKCITRLVFLCSSYYYQKGGFMPKIYCKKCGYGNEYDLKKPNKCAKCGNPFGVVSLKVDPKKEDKQIVSKKTKKIATFSNEDVEDEEHFDLEDFDVSAIAAKASKDRALSFSFHKPTTVKFGDIVGTE